MIKRAIITGATGAIGTALINELVNQGVEVLVFARENSKRNEQIPNSPLVTIKYCSLDKLATVQNDTGKDYDVFYHFAWAGTTGSSRNDMYMQNSNVKFTLDAVHTAKRFGCRTFIGAGSQAEYGRVEGRLTPQTPAFPENGYGMAKLCAGEMSRVLCNQLEINHIWVRILSIYGLNDGAGSMVMSTINQLKNGEIPQFTKGEQVWDYLSSFDAARAFYMLGDSDISDKTYVLGSGNPRPLKDYIFAIRNAVAPNAEIALGAVPYADKQVMHLSADITSLAEDIGWKPVYSFEDGINKMLSDGGFI